MNALDEGYQHDRQGRRRHISSTAPSSRPSSSTTRAATSRRSAPTSASRCSPPTSDAEAIEELMFGRSADVQGDRTRAVPDRRRSRRHGLGWRLRDHAPLPGGPGQRRDLHGTGRGLGVGVIPGWGGCKEMLLRLYHNPKRPGGPMPAVAEVFEMISTAYVDLRGGGSRRRGPAPDGRHQHEPRPPSLDAEAKALAMLAAGYQAAPEQEIALPGRPAARRSQWPSTASAPAQCTRDDEADASGLPSRRRWASTTSPRRSVS